MSRSTSLPAPSCDPSGGGAQEKSNRCYGAYVLDSATGQVRTIGADNTVLATGGAGKVYLYTTNPDRHRWMEKPEPCEFTIDTVEVCGRD